MSDEEKFCGVDTLIERMKTHPEEFFESGEKRSRWSFMYKDYFKDSLTESEKGRIHEALRVVRRMEFDALIVKELMKDEQQEQVEDDEFPKHRGKYLMQGARGTTTLTTSQSNGTSGLISGFSK